jgi:3-dehydroquinate synthase
MRLDKKNRAGTLRLILWRGIERAEIVEGVDDAAVMHVLQTTEAEMGGG